MSITRDFKLSLVAGRSVPLVINANQYDDGEIWRFTLLDENGQKYSPSTGSIIGLKSDGHIIANAGTVSSTGLVIIAETEQMTASPGKNFYELLIDDDTHGTANFIVFVEPRPGADGTPSDSDLAVFQEAIDAAATIGDVVDLVDDVAVLEARMDTFTQLTEGSTTGDAELMDIRVGADGTIYPNAGDAVRGQVSDLKNALNNIGVDFDTIASTWTKVYINSSGVETETNTRITSDYIPASQYPSFLALINSGYKYRVAYYDGNQQFSSLGDYTTVSGTVNNSGYVRITVAKTADSSIQVTDSSNISLLFVTGTDKTLTLSDHIADSKVTGDKIANIESSLNVFGNLGTDIPYEYNPESEKGTISGSTGQNAGTASNRIRTTGYIKTSSLLKTDIKPSAGIELNVFFYDENKTFIRSTGFLNYDFWFAFSGFYRVAIKKSDDTNFADFVITNYIDITAQIGTAHSTSLSGRKWTACGDSFTHGDFTNSPVSDYNIKYGVYTGEHKVYPFLIANRVCDLSVVNEAISGSTMTSGTGSSNPFSGTRYQQISNDTDIITMMFGINDANNRMPIGTIDDDVNTTFYGAWNVVLEYLITNYPSAHIGIIVGPGMSGETSQPYAEAEINVAKKWGIPYLDFTFESGNENLPLMLRTANPNVSDEAKLLRRNQQVVDSDLNQHPNAIAHEFESYTIQDFISRI